MRFYSILALTIEFLDSEVLLDCLKENFDITVSHVTVGNILNDLGYSRQQNKKYDQETIVILDLPGSGTRLCPKSTSMAGSKCEPSEP